MLRGLFVGIDRYTAEGVQWLTAAARDATALHALFSDTLGGEATLLTDRGATKDAIAGNLARLAGCSPDDFVVVTFSGHGTQTCELAPVDADPYSPGGLISVDDLSGWLADIPARNVLVVLDCCFSGGHGAKVFQHGVRRRDGSGTAADFDRVVGSGRLLLMASAADQEAIEDVASGHGLLTSELLTALQGAPEVVSAGTVKVFRLLEFVAGRVADRARDAGRIQVPTIRGSLDGDVAWPVFTPGPAYRAAFPNRTGATATGDPASLTGLGFPPALVAAWAGEISSLNELQVAAINDFGVLRGENLLVSSPTSSGKTMVGELAALHGALLGRRAMFLLPTKALVYDKKAQFERLYGAYGIRTVEATGETDDIAPLIRGRFDLALLTNEKFMAMAIAFPHVLDGIGTIVVDEVQLLADETRGWNLEFLLTLVRTHQKTSGMPQVVALSAVIGDTNGLERWLGGRLLRRHARPVPLDEGLLLSDGLFRFRDGADGSPKQSGPLIRPLAGKGSSQDWIIPLVWRLVNEGKKVIVFRQTTGEARGCAEYLTAAIGLPPVEEALAGLPSGDPSRASHALRACLSGGVAFHHSHLSPGERRVVEDQFRKRDGRLRVLAATTTLAMGVNTPAEAVVIAGLNHPGGKPYSVAEYKNLAGRAGRLGFSEHGASYLLATDSRQEHDLWTRYVAATPENLASRFLDADPGTMVVRVVAATRRRSRPTATGMTADAIVDFLGASFGAFQLETDRTGRWPWNRDRLLSELVRLEKHGLVQSDGGGRYGLTPLGELAGETGLEVASVTRVATCLSRLHPNQVTDPTLLAVAQLTVELDQVGMPYNRKSVEPGHKEPVTWFGELRQQGIAESVLSALRSDLSEKGQDVMRAKKAVACLLYIQGADMLGIEAALTRFGGASGGVSGQVRQAASRACDVLPAVVKAAGLLHPGLQMDNRLERLLIRLELGVSGQVAELAVLARGRLDRDDYQRIAAAAIMGAAPASKLPDAELAALVGGDPDKLSIVKDALRRVAEARVGSDAMETAILAPYVQ